MKHIDINFLVGGIARSGTSALASVLNLHPHVFCGMETFNLFDEDLAVKTFPRDFMNPSHKHYAYNFETMKKKNMATLVAVGDKRPENFMNLSSLKNLKFIFIQRSYQGYVPSWNKRANDASWDMGRVGVFAIFDFLLSVIFLANSPAETMRFVSYNNLFYGDWEHEVKKCCDLLAVDFSRFGKKEFLELSYNRESLAKKVRVPLPHEREFAEYVNIKMIEDEFDKHHSTETMLSIYLRYANWIIANLQDIHLAFIKTVAKYENVHCSAYLEHYLDVINNKAIRHLALTDRDTPDSSTRS